MGSSDHPIQKIKKLAILKTKALLFEVLCLNKKKLLNRITISLIIL
jgi:hypothetical protein